MLRKNSEFVIDITPERIQHEYKKDLFRYRELFYFFAWRDIVVKYKQTALGVLWAIIRPLINMAVFALVFGKIASLPSDNISYPLFVLAGMVPWQLFSSCLVDSSNSLLNHSAMISKIYFPRIVLPVSCIMVHFVDFFISLILLFVLFFVLGYSLQISLLCLPIFIVLTLLFCTGASLWLSAAAVHYRDFRFIMPFIIQFGMFISPVGYGSFLVPEAWRWLYFLNPMAGIIEGFRWCCFGVYHPDFPLAMLLSCLINGLILVTGFRYFRKMERIFADII